MLVILPWNIEAFSFSSPSSLLFLAVIPLLIGVYVWMQQRRRRYAVRYASVSLVREAIGKGPGIRRHIPAAVYMLAIAAMVLALARPQGIVDTASDRGIVVLAIDVSGSMYAEDVEPNRMEATKEAAKNFVEKQPNGVQVGIISFSDFGSLVQPPTTDKRAVIEAIDRLSPQRGTNIGGGLQAALDSIYDLLDVARPAGANAPVTPGGAPVPTPIAPPIETRSGPLPASIVLVSDGQSNTGPDPVDVADEAVAAGIKVYTIGIGTPEGTVLRIQGRNVFTRLDEATLREVAELTDGQYYSAQDEAELSQIYEELARERYTEPTETELTFWMTGIALVFSVAAGAFSLVWFNRLP